MLYEEYAFPSKYDKPMSQQIKMFEFYMANKRAFNLSTMGTGKTLASLWAADFLIHNRRIKKVLIISPLTLLGAVWGKEIFESMPYRKYTILHGSKQERLKRLALDRSFYIINFDGIKTIEEEIIKMKFDLIIIDELTAFKNSMTDRTKAMIRISKKAKAIWGLTGSPTANSPVDAYGQAKVVNWENPDLPKFFTQFRDLVVEQDEFDEYGWVPIIGWQHTVKKILHPQIRYELRDCVDLPPTVYMEREVKMSEEQTKVYKQMRKDFIAEYNEHKIVAANAGVKYSKLLQISSGVVYSDDKQPVRLNATPKMNELIDIYEQGGNEPVVVLITYVEAIHMVKDHLKKYRVEMIYGDVPLAKRTEIIDRFQKGLIDFILMQPVTASHGITLTRSATLVWYTPFPSNERTRQANSRIIRPGQTRTQLIIRLYSSESEKKLYTGIDNDEDMSLLLTNLLKEEMRA